MAEAAESKRTHAKRTSCTVESVKHEISEDELRKVFAQFDADKSGSIDERELHQAMKQLGVSCTINVAIRVLASIDTDRNGTVEWDEFQAFFSKVSDPEDLKDMLSKSSRRFFEYKQAVETDTSFAKTFKVPPLVSPKKRYDGHNEAVERVAWLSDEELVSGSIDGEILIWSATDPAKRPRPKRRFQAAGGAPLYSMAALEESRRLLVGLDGKGQSCLRLLSIDEEAELVAYEGHSSPVYSSAFSSDSLALVSGSKSGVICLHDAAAQACQHSMQAHSSVVHCLDYRRNSSVICSASKDGAVKIFDTRNLSHEGKADAMIEDAATTGTVLQALWRGDTEIISCGDDYCIKRWDVRSLDEGPVSSFFGHTSTVRALCISPDEQFIVSGAQSGSIRVWCSDQLGAAEARLIKLELELQALACDRDDKQEQVEEGGLEPEHFKAAQEKIAECEERYKAMKEACSQLSRNGYSQADIGCEGLKMPVSSLAWRDGCAPLSPRAGASAANVRLAVGAQDQAVRIYELDTRGIVANMF